MFGIFIYAFTENSSQSVNIRCESVAKAMIHLLGLFAELERNFIVSRTQEGRKATGRLGGRPPKLTDDVKQTVRKKFTAGASKAALSREFGVSRVTIKRIVEAT